MARRSFLTGSQYEPPPVDRALAALAATQHGLVTVAQLRAVGLDSAAVAKRAAAGRLHRVHRGVYAVGHGALPREGRWMAAVLAAGPGAALSHYAAAALWEIRRGRVPGIDVVAPRARHVDGIAVHRCRHLDARDVIVWNGIPVTTVARTLVDLTDGLEDHELANLIHEAAFRKRFSVTATREAMARANGRRHLARLGAAIDAHLSGSAGTKSTLESQFLSLVEGLPEPLVNVKVHGLEVDLHWPEHRVCVEIDGGGHARPRTRREDAARERVLRAAGFTVLRFARDDSHTDPTDSA